MDCKISEKTNVLRTMPRSFCVSIRKRKSCRQSSCSSILIMAKDVVMPPLWDATKNECEWVSGCSNVYSCNETLFPNGGASLYAAFIALRGRFLDVERESNGRRMCINYKIEVERQRVVQPIISGNGRPVIIPGDCSLSNFRVLRKKIFSGFVLCTEGTVQVRRIYYLYVHVYRTSHRYCAT